MCLLPEILQNISDSTFTSTLQHAPSSAEFFRLYKFPNPNPIPNPNLKFELRIVSSGSVTK